MVVPGVDALRRAVEKVDEAHLGQTAPKWLCGVITRLSTGARQSYRHDLGSSDGAKGVHAACPRIPRWLGCPACRTTQPGLSMLEQMRRQGASIFIYFIFGLLIVIFVINFAPSRNRGGLEGGCSTSSNTVIGVDGAEANQSAYLIAYSANGASGRQKVYLALDQLVRR